jgi:Mor family transcriptional regulator
MDNAKITDNITPIFLIGAMKSGTSSLFKYLECQDEICFPPIKEPEYFSKNMGLKKYKQMDFWDLYDLKPYHKFVFDGSTGYTKYPAESGVPMRIYDYGLKPKFIYIVRNPIDRIQSHYNFMKRDLNWKGNITSEHLICVSNYYLQLKQYEEYFNTRDFLILDFDDLKTDPKNMISKIAEFIGLSNLKLTETNIKSNSTKPINRSELKLKKKLSGKFIFLPKSIKLVAKKLIFSFFKNRKKELTRKEKSKIKNQLQSDMTKFKNEYGFPVEKWGF